MQTEAHFEQQIDFSSAIRQKKTLPALPGSLAKYLLVQQKPVVIGVPVQ
jgi:hypothetical protein